MDKKSRVSAIMFGLGVIMVMLSLTVGIIAPQTFNFTPFFITALIGCGIGTLGMLRLLVRPLRF